jgi:hypothetical protein
VYDGDLLTPRLSRARREGEGGRARAEDVPLDHEEPLSAQARAVGEALEDALEDGQRSPAVATGTCGARAVAIAERAALMMARHAEAPRSGSVGRAAEKL